MKGYVRLSQQQTGMYRDRFYQSLNCHSTAVEHCRERQIAYASLTGNIEISIRERGSITSEVVLASRIALQFRHHALVVLQKSCTCVKFQDAEENVLVVCKVGHTGRLDMLNMGVFGALTAGVIRLSWVT